MDDTREIVSAATIRTIMLAIGIGGPILGAAAGLAVGIARRCILPDLLSGFGVGLLGLLVLGMWEVYNCVQRRLGFDSVAGLVLNIGIFVVVGIAVGVMIAILMSRRRAPSVDR